MLILVFGVSSFRYGSNTVKITEYDSGCDFRSLFYKSGFLISTRIPDIKNKIFELVIKSSENVHRWCRQ